MLDARAMTEACETLLQALPDARGALPFALADTLGLWLLDPDDRPLVLLATRVPGADSDPRGLPLRWDAGGRGECAFVSMTLTEAGIPERDASDRRPHVEALEQAVARAAGREARRRWFDWGSGHPVAIASSDAAAAAPDPTRARRLERDDFPSLRVRFDWPNAGEHRLFDEYRGWLWPYLLSLPSLVDHERRGLERAAAPYGRLVDRTWRRDPRILDQALFNRIRVEAKLSGDHP
jgi:hypothetical protein